MALWQQEPKNLYTGNRRRVMTWLGNSGHPRKDDPTNPDEEELEFGGGPVDISDAGVAVVARDVES
jgi:hypothetical protein